MRQKNCRSLGACSLGSKLGRLVPPRYFATATESSTSANSLDPRLDPSFSSSHPTVSQETWIPQLYYRYRDSRSLYGGSGRWNSEIPLTVCDGVGSIINLVISVSTIAYHFMSIAIRVPPYDSTVFLFGG